MFFGVIKKKFRLYFFVILLVSLK